MSQLNKNKISSSVSATSFEGNKQTLKSVELELYDIVSSSLLGKQKFYESSDDILIRLQSAIDTLVKDGKTDFVTNLAIHARTNLHIRSMPIVMLVVLAKSLRDNKLSYANLRKSVTDVIQRADEITDLYAYALTVFGDKKSVPLAIKKGVADAFNTFNEYAFGKYAGKRKQLSIKDTLRIVHPKAISIEQGEIFKKIIAETIAIPYTWETELSKNDKPKKQVWEELIDSKKMGYMATIRNLRNMLEAKISNEHIDTLCDYISNETAVKNSKQFPYRFLNSLISIEMHTNNKLNAALAKAMEISLSNIPDLGDNIWIIVDCSGSMGPGYNDCSPFEKASLFAAAIAKRHGDKNVKLTMFSDNAKHINYNPQSNLIDIVHKLKSEVYGSGTNLSAALSLRDTLGFTPTTVIVFSDMQIQRLRPGDLQFLKDPSMLKIAVDLSGYNTTPLDLNSRWLQVSGYSDSIFNYISIKNSKGSILSKLSKPYIGLESIKTI